MCYLHFNSLVMFLIKQFVFFALLYLGKKQFGLILYNISYVDELIKIAVILQSLSQLTLIAICNRNLRKFEFCHIIVK